MVAPLGDFIYSLKRLFKQFLIGKITRRYSHYHHVCKNYRFQFDSQNEQGNFFIIQLNFYLYLDK